MNGTLSLLSRLFTSRRSFGFIVLAALVGLRMADPAPLEEIRLRSFDLLQSIHPREATTRPVVIVDIDEASLSTYGQWPWPRTLIADLLTRMYERKIAAVAFDVVFAEPDRSSPAEALRHFRSLDDSTRESLLRLPSNDDVFAAAIGQGKVVLGQSGTRAESAQTTERFPETSIATVGPDPRPALYAFPRLLRNLPKLERASAGRGLFTIATEKDGMVRRVPLVMRAENELVPALAVDLLRVASGAQNVLVRSDTSGVRSVAIQARQGLELPTDPNGRVWVHFAPHDMSRYISARDVIEGTVPAEQLAGKMVLIGTSAIGLLDLKTTPVHSAMPGVEIHAQLIEGALTNSLLKAPGWVFVAEMIGSILAGALLALLAPMVSARMLFLTALLLTAAFLGTTWVSYSRFQTLFDPTFPMLVTLAIYVGLTLIGYFREQVDRQRIRSAFAQYLSPSLVEQLANSPEKLVLGGEVRNMTVLFSDVRGFTAISESFANDPQGLTLLMNRLLTPLTHVIMARNGTIDKYMGDAVMAFWNAPLEDPTHHRDACHASLDMLASVDDLNKVREREAAESGARFIPIRMGIGINTGHCVVGNMGSELRFQYTVMGDSVNLASRLEGQTATYHIPIIIGSNTAQAVADEFALLEVDTIRVKGKNLPEVIYCVVGRDGMATTDAFTSLRDLWSKVLVCYRKQDWDGVLALIEQCRPLCHQFGLDDLATIYADRAQEFRKVPPPAAWDGVYTAQTK